MKLLKYLFILSVSVLLISSCTRRTKSTPSTNLNVQVNFNMEDLEYIGEVTGSSKQSYLFGVIPVGGRRFHTGAIGIGNGGFLGNLSVRRGVNNALYDALMSKPDADFVLPVSYFVESDGMFLGRKDSIIIKAKAFKLKVK
ncbi:MAG TPA: hypothetical protein VIK89_06265 [Cytophagaceae bacterium]